MRYGEDWALLDEWPEEYCPVCSNLSMYIALETRGHWEVVVTKNGGAIAFCIDEIDGDAAAKVAMELGL